jgi:ectoine hydroxylase-related dioxygenase (phytanoyl-CoA dioxygenase family)
MSPILSHSDIELFYNEGYLIIKEVYSHHDIENGRQIFKMAFNDKLWRSAPNSNENIINNIYSILPELLPLIINDKFLQLAKELLGDEIYWIPECSIHRNQFVKWHKDTWFHELNGMNSHHNIENPLLQFATYFQDNSEDGGGLTVIPGTQTNEDTFADLYDNDKVFKRIVNKFKKMIGVSSFDRAESNPKKLNLLTKKGDLLIFDLRIDHRSSYPRNKKQTNPLDKLAIFNTFGKRNETTLEYFKFMKHSEAAYYHYLHGFQLPKTMYKLAANHEIEILF